MRRCSICKKVFVKETGTTFFSVPKDLARRQRWAKSCGRDFKKSHLICEDHFSPTSIVRSCTKWKLLPSAEPFPKLRNKSNCVRENLSSEINDTTNVMGIGVNKNVTSNKIVNFYDNVTNKSSSAQTKFPETTDTFLSNHAQVYEQNLSNSSIDSLPPQLEEPIVQMPIVKSISCSGYTQTNIRLCGLVEASDFADEFRFSCFYCSEVFALEKWKNFVNHLKDSHFKEEEAFQTSKYLSKEHDYTPISLPLPEIKDEPVEYNSESSLASLVDPLQNHFESVAFSSNLILTSYNKSPTTNFVKHCPRQNPEMNKINSKRKSKQVIMSSSRFYSKTQTQQIPKISALNRCLKRTIEEQVEVDENFETNPLKVDPENPTEIAFEYTPRPIVNLLLDNMKQYPVLWQLDTQPFNEDFFEAVENLCNVINNEFSLNIDNLKMRRSVNRILRFYCHLFPNENNHQFTCYYSKCAKFLPCVNEIAYARCSHCYVCFESDFELKLHLVEEQKYLEWPYKCSQCKESFRLWDEFEFHKHLPHYDEIFRCQECKLSFFRRLTYKKHMVEEHQSVNEPGRFKCDICDRALESMNGLRAHKKSHGEPQHKCHLCPKTYHEKSRLELHLKMHRQQHDFMCEVCGKKFIRQTALTIHMTKHTGEKVTCKVCGLRLRKSSLGRHMRIVHAAHARPLQPAVQRFLSKGKQICLGRLIKAKPKGVPLKRKSGSAREYKCKICKISLDNYKLTVEHNKEMHSDVPMWPCKMCATEFNSKFNLKGHYRRKHKLHTLQVYKLVDENEDLNVVLAIKEEDIQEICESVKSSRCNPKSITKSDSDSTIKTSKSDNEPPIKTDLMSGEIFFPEDKFHSSTIQDEIMNAVDDIETQDIKIDDINELLSDYLK